MTENLTTAGLPLGSSSVFLLGAHFHSLHGLHLWLQMDEEFEAKLGLK